MNTKETQIWHLQKKRNRLEEIANANEEKANELEEEKIKFCLKAQKYKRLANDITKEINNLTE